MHNFENQPMLEVPPRQGSEREQWATANRHMAFALVILLGIAMGSQILVPDIARWGTAAIFGVFFLWVICVLEYASRSNWIAITVPSLLLPVTGSVASLVAMAYASPTVFMWVIPAMFITFMRVPWKWAMASGIGTMLVAQIVALAALHVDTALFIRISLSGIFSLILFTLFFRTATNTRLQLDRTRANLATANQSLEAANLELNRHRAHLEELVQERTRNLIAARGEAESANAVKNNFMSNVSHEMRHPLQRILGYAEVGKLRLEEASLQEIDAHLENILTAGTQMHKLVESLLTLANKSWDDHAGLNHFESQQIDVADFFHALGTLMEIRAGKSGHRFVMEAQTSSMTLMGDPGKLQQVFEHLLSNALRYSPPSSTVTWRVAPVMLAEADSQNAVEAVSFEILDQGCGIPESEMKAVLEPFYESTRTASGAGSTGLGLPLSQCIVARHGGRISLSNRAGGGLCCQVKLPANMATADILAPA